MKKINDSEETKKPPIKEPVKMKEKMIPVTYRYNNKFDLHIGRKMMTFKGRETKGVPTAWLNHKDWDPVKKYFAVKGA